ncbi:dTDP-glucose 4,6-dehydratase [Maricaulaceae bacterium EIL42A08]|nr:dTDP-glucose 4,6-dehydratase [Maricaulaceae bacterium EIL42A08]
MKTALVTGGAGFIGSSVTLELLETGWDVVVLDALTYAAAPGTVEMLERSHARLIKEDLRHGAAVRDIMATTQPDAVFHLAAESHVDRSIDAPGDFVTTNVNGTLELLEAFRAHQKPGATFIQVSTDEVFGSLDKDDPAFTETSRYAPSSPYSASKAGADHLVRAWGATHGLDVRISNCSNNYGPRQFPEKLIPLMTLKALSGSALPVYGDGSNIRDWLHVADHAKALRLIAERGKARETYCIGGNAERSNLQVVETICDYLDTLKPLQSPRRSAIEFVADRPGHDWRYAINSAKAQAELDWSPAHSFEEGLQATIDWYLDNRSWWEPLTERYSGTRLGVW